MLKYGSGDTGLGMKRRLVGKNQEIQVVGLR